MTNKTSRLLLMLTLFIACFTSCSDEEKKYGTVKFTKTGLYVDAPGASASTTFTTKDVEALSVQSFPEGWDVNLTFGNRTITVTAPADLTEEDVEISGKVRVSGISPGGATVYGSFNVGIVDFEDLEPQQANSMIVSEPNKIYTFSHSFKGEESMGASLSGVASCDLLWGSVNRPIAHVQLMGDDKIAFFTNIDENDLDADGDKTDLIEGNGVIAAYNKSGDIIWSWHIWVTESQPTAQSFNGVEFMDRNLGAAMNSVASQDDVMSSYGLYYQWGRKDPFIYPSTYNAAGGVDGYMSNDYGVSRVIYYVESSASVGSVDYATKNPLTYIYGSTESDQDWVYSGHSTTLWSDSQKSVYDPSPKGWRVPAQSDLDALTIAEIPATQPSYGCTLVDASGAELLFMGLGRRSYLSGRLENVNSEYDPWTGYYWSSTASATQNRAAALKFSNLNNIDCNIPLQRANAMQIRCVKVK